MKKAKRNSDLINKRFASLAKKVQKASLAAVMKGTKAGHDKAIEFHELYHHELHLTLEGDFGYAVKERGITKDYVIRKSQMAKARTAEKALTAFLGTQPKKVAGRVSAGMAGAPFNPGWEETILHKSASYARWIAIQQFAK